jgi:hypothetical protein
MERLKENEKELERHTTILLHQVHEELGLLLFDRDDGSYDGE